MRIWCCGCDKNMKYDGKALDHPVDGSFYICPGCQIKIVVFKDQDRMWPEYEKDDPFYEK